MPANTVTSTPPYRVPQGEETLKPFVRAYRPADAISSWAATLVVVAPNILGATANTTGAPIFEEPTQSKSPIGRGVDDAERAVFARQELLAREYVRGQLSREEAARLLIATERAAAYFPRVTADDYERLSAAAERSKTAHDLLSETDELLADL